MKGNYLTVAGVMENKAITICCSANQDKLCSTGLKVAVDL